MTHAELCEQARLALSEALTVVPPPDKAKVTVALDILRLPQPYEPPVRSTRKS